MGFSQIVNEHKTQEVLEHTLTNMNKDIRLMGPVAADRCANRHTRMIPTRHTLLLLVVQCGSLLLQKNTASLANFKETAAHSLARQLNSEYHLDEEIDSIQQPFFLV